MANGKSLVDGITYLANTYCEGNLEGVFANLHVEEDDELTVYLASEEGQQMDFTPQDIAFMSGCGFWHHKAGDGFTPTQNYPTDYSWFGIAIV